jgi:LytS/YehU family sensor histidine kinase
LIREGGAEQAEEKTEHLADFLRETLSLDPHGLISVEEEASLQRIYLDIQKVRFPTRLNPAFDIAEDARKAKVPNLILQPLIENSITHAVARSTAPVSVRVRAEIEGSKLRIEVEDDGGNSAGQAPARGHGIGLANVAERLSAQFGREAEFSAGSREEGGFRNVMLIPLVRGS